MNKEERPKFYLKILNGYGMSFGIKVYLDNNKDLELFSVFNLSNYDNRIDLFKKFIINENLGLLNFSFDIYHDDAYINMRWRGESSDNQNSGRQDCRKWIWELNSFRNRVVLKDKDTGGNIITKI